MRGPGLDGERLLIRADASMHIGTGHVMRCLALSQAWQEAGGTAHFVLAEATPALEARLISEGIDITHLTTPPGGVADAEQTVALAQQEGASWVVVDGYQFDATYQRSIKEACLRMLFVDDYGHAAHYYADLVLNQNIYADSSLYPNREPYTQLLLGTRYALLRREFSGWPARQRAVEEVGRKVLVTMGGADPDNVTQKVLEALQQAQVAGLEVKVVIGGSNPHRENLRRIARMSEALRVCDLIENTPNMPELMAWADAAVSGGGSTCWELAFMGLPTLTLILAEHQRATAEMLAQKKVTICLGEAANTNHQQIESALLQLLNDRHLRRAMVHNGKALVDGAGAKRVVRRLLAVEKGRGE